MIIGACENSLQKFIEKGCRTIGDIGHSLMYKSFIELLFQCYTHLLKNKEEVKCSSFIHYLEQLKKIPISHFDNEILCLLLGKIQTLIQIPEMKDHELTKTLTSWTKSLTII